jgi:hypothetical protein
MDHKLELPPYIDASDFDNRWWEPGATGDGYVPVRFGFKEAGRVKVSLGEGKVELRVLAAYSAGSGSQTVALKRFKADGQEHLCLGCQCGKLHKRLFMVALKKRRPNDSTGAFAFVCKECGGIETALDRKMRRRREAVRKRSLRLRPSPVSVS